MLYIFIYFCSFQYYKKICPFTDVLVLYNAAI